MLVTQRYRDPPPGMPLVLALFSFRYDAHLVPGLVANLRPIVHGHIAWDDRAASGTLSSEPARRNALLAEAQRQRAGWLLTCDPDERFEDRLAERLPDLVSQGDNILWRFHCREMFSPTHWRADGIWGGKRMIRLFPAAAATGGLDTPLHGGWVAEPGRFRQRDARLAFYHLRMAHPARRALRRRLYAAVDPGRLHQGIGYDYLDDERAMVLQPVAEARRFSPPFVEDGGLWAPDPGDLGDPAPDPFEARLSFAATCLKARAGIGPALHALADLAAASPADTDLQHVLARAALRAGQPGQALALSERLLDRAPGDLHAHLLRAEAAGHLGRTDAAHDSLAALDPALDDFPLLAQLRARALPQAADLTGKGALWRRWVRGEARAAEGARLPATARLAVVVIGFRAQPGLAAAVRSVLAQPEAAEVVVVHSGGGDVRSLLGGLTDRLRLIEVEEPLYVGAARNIGIDASRAPFVAFLAGDCTAEPGWIAARLRAHEAGAAMVSSPVLPAAGAGPVALASHFLKYGLRHPAVAPEAQSHYGRSYARWVLDAAGCYPPGLRIAEDDRMNALTDRLALPVWAADAAVRHAAVNDLAALLRDERARGARRADHPPYRALAGADGPDDRIEAAARIILLQAARAADALAGMRGRALSSLLATQWLVLKADRAGLAEALVRIAQADALWAQARALRREDPARALTLAQEAWQMDSQDWRKPLLAGLLMRALGQPGAAAMVAVSAALDPQRPEPALTLVSWARSDEGPAAALQQAGAALCRAPGSETLWRATAGLWLAQGLPDQATACLRVALALSPASGDLHEDLARQHRQRGDMVLSAFRSLSARRIGAWPGRGQGGAPGHGALKSPPNRNAAWPGGLIPL